MAQHWEKLGLIYDGNGIDGYNYATVPYGIFISEDVLRIYFSSRDGGNRSIPFFLDYDLALNKIVHLNTTPLLECGDLGCFDDSGIMPNCVVNHKDELWMYYIGWNLGVTVPFRNSIGLAISRDGGRTFKRAFDGPVLDRAKDEPHFVAGPNALFDEGKWKMWYLNCIKWEKIGNLTRHFYHIKYSESSDGVNWVREGKVAIDFRYGNEYAISSPRVVKENGKYKMWYSYRGGDISDTYRIGYAESGDGYNWIRKDELVQMDVSPTGWDAEMICYPCIFDYKGKRYMLYNGNGYGKTGFGIAQLMK